MIIDNLLDNLGIISYPDKQVEDDPNLKQGEELRKFERNYKTSLQPTLKNLQVTSSPKLDSQVEGMTNDNINDNANIPSSVDIGGAQNPARIINEINEAKENYENAFDEYVNSKVTNVTKNNPTEYNSILVNNNNKLEVKIYNKKLSDYTKSLYSSIKHKHKDKKERISICGGITNSYNIENGSWGDAKTLPPIIDFWQTNCMEGNGKSVSEDDVTLPNPYTDNLESYEYDLNSCPLDYPIACGKASGNIPENTTCNTGGSYYGKCTGLKLNEERNGGKTVSNYIARVNKKKFTVKSWPGFAIAGVLPIGINKEYNGHYTIIYYETKTKDDCADDFIFMEDMTPVYMTGRLDQEPNERVSWYPSITGSKMTGCFYIKPDEKINLANEIDSALLQIIEYSGGVNEILRKGAIEAVGENGEYLNPHWLGPAILKHDNFERKAHKKGICRSQHGGYFNLGIQNVVNKTMKAQESYKKYQIPKTSDNGIIIANKNIGDTIQSNLYSGGLCTNNSIRHCPHWNNYNISSNESEHKLYKTCQLNTVGQQELDPIEYTINLVGELIRFRKALFGSQSINLDALYDLNKLNNNELKIETCQDLRDAYKIYTYKDKNKNKKEIFNGCNTSDKNIDINNIWNNSGCNEENSFGGPSLKSRLYGKGCSSTNGLVSKGVDGLSSPPIPSDKDPLYTTRKVYTDKVYINKYGYSHDLGGILAKPLEELETKINNCTIQKTPTFKKKQKNELCYGKNGSFDVDNNISDLIDKINNPLPNCSKHTIIPQHNVSSFSGIGVGAGVPLTESNSKSCNGGILDVGSIIYGKDKHYYWLDEKGYKTKIPVGNEKELLKMLTSKKNNNRCMGYFGVQKKEDLMSMIKNISKSQSQIDITTIPDSQNTGKMSISNLICSSYDRSTYEKVIKQASILKDKVNTLAKIIKENKNTNKKLDTSISNEEKNIEKLIIKVNNDMDVIDKINQDKSTNEAREESTALIKDSTKFQYLMWIIIGVLLFLYSIFGISSSNASSPFHIIIMVVCVIIAFIILRRIYLSGI